VRISRAGLTIRGEGERGMERVDDEGDGSWSRPEP
jgi:hypothetical protein